MHILLFHCSTTCRLFVIGRGNICIIPFSTGGCLTLKFPVRVVLKGGMSLSPEEAQDAERGKDTGRRGEREKVFFFRKNHFPLAYGKKSVIIL